VIEQPRGNGAFQRQWQGEKAMTSIITKRMVLTIFPAALLSACVSQSKYDELQAQNQQLQAQNQSNQQQITSLNQQVERLQNAIRYTVNSDLLFASGSWQLSEDGKSLMARIASQLAPFQTRHIVINGYTDNQPVGSQLRRQGIQSNEVLSQRRAQSVMDFLTSQGVQSQFMSAKGWGAANPIAPNNSVAGRSENRRVEITFGSAQAAQMP
jgi:chemotaxis protein MotB